MEYITYAHEAKPQGPRFRQSVRVSVPKWAVDIRSEAADRANAVNGVLIAIIRDMDEEIRVLQASLVERKRAERFFL